LSFVTSFRLLVCPIIPSFLFSYFFRSSFLHVCSFIQYSFIVLFIILQAMIAVPEKYKFSVQLAFAWQYPIQFTMSYENSPTRDLPVTLITLHANLCCSRKHQ
jgi:hypothetical protein